MKAKKSLFFQKTTRGLVLHNMQSSQLRAIAHWFDVCKK